MKRIQTALAQGGHRFTFSLPERYETWGRTTVRRRPVGGTAKRAFDIFAALFLLVVLSPLLIGLAVLISATSSGSVFYAHRRVGFDGQAFRCLKFRTMRADGDEVLKRHLDLNPAARAEWEETRKLRDDPRVTAVGQTLRKLSLDELPQLINVLRGEMSFVGPRPVVSDELIRYGRSNRYYLRARPGITGLWQVSGRSNTSYARRIAFDRVYVLKSGTAMDMSILARTLPAVIRSDETA